MHQRVRLWAVLNSTNILMRRGHWWTLADSRPLSAWLTFGNMQVTCRRWWIPLASSQEMAGRVAAAESSFFLFQPIE